MTTICMLSNLFPPVMSGSSIQLDHLSQQLIGRGYRVVVVTAKVDPATPDYEEFEGIRLYRIPALRLPELSICLNFPWLTATFSPSNLRRIERIIREERVDLIHLHNHMFDLAFSAVCLRKRCRLPLVVSMHTPITHNNFFYNYVLVKAEKFILKPLIIDNADALIIPDFNVIPYVQKRFGRNDAVVIPYAVQEHAPPSPQITLALRQRYNLADKRLILSVGHLHEIRNRIDLIHAFQKVKNRIPNALLLIVGAISDRQPVDLVKKLGLEDSVIFAGTHRHEEVGALLHQAEIEAHWFTLQHPALDSSPGIATIEAMLAGKPALTYANENTFGPGVLQHYRNIILVTPGDTQGIADTIVNLLANADLAAEIGKAARQTALQNFSWPSIIARFENLYQGLLKDRSAPAQSV